MIQVSLHLGRGRGYLGDAEVSLHLGIAFFSGIRQQTLPFPRWHRRPPPLVGTVVSVDTTTGDVVVQPEHGKQETVTTDANTEVTIDRNPIP